jgi:outer membrane biosynthesis protein TonB
MESDRFFQYALIISLVTHTIILLRSPDLHLFNTASKPQKIEVSYTPSARIKESPFKTSSLNKDFPLKLPPKATLPQDIRHPLTDTDASQSLLKKNLESLRQQSVAMKPALAKPDTIAVKKKITLPDLAMDKIDNPSYTSYYQIVREKIRRAAYHNYTRTETGEIYLSFVIASDGTLKDTRFMEERSSTNYFLKQISLKSIREAAPFPAFPKELDYPQLSFNVIISFEIE